MVLHASGSLRACDPAVPQHYNILPGSTERGDRGSIVISSFLNLGESIHMILQRLGELQRYQYRCKEQCLKLRGRNERRSSVVTPSAVCSRSCFCRQTGLPPNLVRHSVVGEDVNGNVGNAEDAWKVLGTTAIPSHAHHPRQDSGEEARGRRRSGAFLQ